MFFYDSNDLPRTNQIALNVLYYYYKLLFRFFLKKQHRNDLEFELKKPLMGNDNIETIRS